MRPKRCKEFSKNCKVVLTISNIAFKVVDNEDHFSLNHSFADSSSAAMKAVSNFLDSEWFLKSNGLCFNDWKLVSILKVKNF